MKYTSIFALLCFFLLASCTQEKNTTTQVVPETANQTQTEINSEEQKMLAEEKETMMKNQSGEMESAEMMKKEAMMKEDTMKKEEMMMDTEKTMEKSEASSEEAMMKKWVYTSYDAALVGQTENTVIFFHATWCPSCRAADTGITSGTLPENLSILKADYDTETELKKKYEVLSQHTFVQVDAKWEMIRKWVGGTTLDDISERIN